MQINMATPEDLQHVNTSTTPISHDEQQVLHPNDSRPIPQRPKRDTKLPPRYKDYHM